METKANHIVFSFTVPETLTINVIVPVFTVIFH